MKDCFYIKEELKMKDKEAIDYLEKLEAGNF